MPIINRPNNCSVLIGIVDDADFANIIASSAKSSNNKRDCQLPLGGYPTSV